MLHHLDTTKTIRTIRPVSHAILIAVALNAGAALAEGPTTEDRLIVGGAAGAVGLVGGAATGAAAGWGYDKLNPVTPPTTPTTPSQKAVVDRSSMKANGAKWKNVEVDPPLGASERTSVRQRNVSREYKRNPRAFKQKYHNHREGWELGEEHAKQIDEAKAKQTKELKAEKKHMRAEKRARKQARRNGITEIPKRASRHTRSVRRMERNAAKQFKRGNTIQTLRNKAWELDGKPMKTGTMAGKSFEGKDLPQIKTGTAAARQQAKTAKAAKKSAKTASKAANTAQSVKSGAKLAKTGAKGARMVKGALAGGAVGMVTGAALGVQVPDAVDGVLFAGKLISDPKNAGKNITQAGKDGIKMVGTIATTITNPAKMANNLGNAAKGVGKTLGLDGVFKGKKSVRTRIDANGKCTTNSIFYRCKLANARNQRNATSGRTRYVFKPYNPASTVGASLSNSGRSFARTYNRGTRYIDRNVSRKVHGGYRAASRQINRTYRSASRPVNRQINRTYRSATRQINRTYRSATRPVNRQINRTYRSASRKVNRQVNRHHRSASKTARSFGRGVKKAFRF